MPYKNFQNKTENLKDFNVFIFFLMVRNFVSFPGLVFGVVLATYANVTKTKKKTFPEQVKACFSV